MRRIITILTAAAALAMIASGCSSSAHTTVAAGTNASDQANSGTTATAATAPAEVRAVEPLVKAALRPPTSIILNVPLTKKPPTGLKIGYLEANVAALQAFTPGFQAAAEALGWKLNVIPYDFSSPTAASGAMEEAVAQKVNYIVIVGEQSFQFTAGLAAARAAGIPVAEVLNSTIEAVPGVLGCVGCVVKESGGLKSFSYGDGHLMGEWTLVDSDGNAHVLYDTIPEASGLVTLGQGFKDALAGCSTCTFGSQGFPFSDLGSSIIVQNTVSYLQQHPDINYILFGTGEMATGARAALNAAGIGQQVKIITVDPQLSDFQAIISGQESAVVASPGEGELGWRTVDMIARASIGMSIKPSEYSEMANELVTQANVAQPAEEYVGASNYQAQYKALWHLS